MIVWPWALSSPRISHSASRLCGSSPAVGSSRKRTAGRWKMARAPLSGRRVPPAAAQAPARAEKMKLLQQAVGLAPRLARRHPEQAPVEVEVLPDGELAIERVLLGD